MSKTWDESNWREEYLNSRPLNKRQRELLKNGADSLSASWILQVMHQEWMEMKGYSYPTPPDCSSNLQKSLERWQH